MQLIQHDEFSELLHVVTSGKWTLAGVFEFMEKTKELAVKNNKKKILVDSTSFDSPENEMIRFHTGEKMAELFRYHYKIASIAKAETITRFTEDVAVNRNVKFKVFTSQNDAIKWLLD